MATSRNKRIAKNTVFLYVRMLLIMVVTLYTSRIVLKVLGVEGFGLYNIVGSVVILFSFLRGSIVTAIQRYLNYYLGRYDGKKVGMTFCTSLYIMFGLSGILLVLLETVGLWFLNYQLSIPSELKYSANVVYQISIITFLVNIVRTPYDALIMAHERMSFYAYASIIEAVLKLLVVFLLLKVTYNKVVLYTWLILGVTVVMNVIYLIYTKRNFRVKAFGNSSKESFKELISFSGWNIFGGIADIGYQQGTNMILNIFFGVTLNATMGITNQVKNAVFSFVRNILVAANPQIYQLYSQGEIEKMQQLVLRISRFSFYMFLVVALPIMMNMEEILSLWLTVIPPDGVKFCILVLIFCLFDTLVGPLWTAAQAQGDIKTYQIISSCILLLNLPLTYLAFKLGLPAISLMIIQIGVVILSIIYRIFFLMDKNIINFTKYIKDVILPISGVVIIAVSLCSLINHYIDFIGIGGLIIAVSIYLMVCLLTCFAIGLSRNERQLIYKVFKKIQQKDKV